MSDRLLMSKDHIVVSKPGFDATNPSLPEGDKLFDSNWLFSSTIVEVGLHIDQAGYRNSGRPPQNVIQVSVATNDSYTQVINFNPLPYIPTVMLISLADSRYWSDYGAVLMGVDPVTSFGRPSEYYRAGEITVTNSQIIVPRGKSGNGGWHYREDFIYLIMAM